MGFWKNRPLIIAVICSILLFVLLPYSLTMPQYLSGWLSWEYQRWCWGIGLGWTAGSTFLGMLAFRRQDVR